MTERALKDLGWFDFPGVAWWLGLFYRWPKQLRKALEALAKMRVLRAGDILMTHALIYWIFIAAVGSLLLFGGLGLSLQESPSNDSALLLANAKELALGITAGIAFGFALGIVEGIDEDIRDDIVVKAGTLTAFCRRGLILPPLRILA